MQMFPRPIFRLTRAHAWLMERLLVRPVRNDVTIIKAGAKGFFGRTPCLDSRKWSRTVGESATHTATCQQPRPLLSCFACKAPSMTPVAGCTSSPTHWLPFNNTCCFLILRCFYLSSPLRVFFHLFFFQYFLFSPSLCFSPSLSLSPSFPSPHSCLSTPFHLYCWIQTGYLYRSAWLLHPPTPITLFALCLSVKPSLWFLFPHTCISTCVFMLKFVCWCGNMALQIAVLYF